MLLAFLSAINNMVNNSLLISVISFWEKNILCTIRNTTPKCNIACITSHNLDNTASFMWCRSISYLVYSLHSCIDCCIESDSIICTCNIKVNSSRKSNRVNTCICKLLCASERTITTDNYHAINTMLLTYLCCLLLSFFCHELQTPGCIKNCTTSLYDIWYTLFIHINNLIIDKTIVTLLYSFYLKSFVDSCSYDSSYRRIHTRGIATAC